MFSGLQLLYVFVYIQEHNLSSPQAHVSGVASSAFRVTTRALALGNGGVAGSDRKQSDDDQTEKDKAEKEKADAETRRSSEEIEEKMYNALMGKQSRSKRNGPAAAPPAAGAIRKRPAAAAGKGGVGAAGGGGKHASVKALGKVIKIQYKVTWSKKEGDDKRTRNVYTCKQYDRAKRELKKMKSVSPEDFKATLRHVMQKAGEMWDKMAKK